MSEAMVKLGAVPTASSGGGLMRRLNLATAVGAGVLLALPSAGSSSHQLPGPDDASPSNQVTLDHDDLLGHRVHGRHRRLQRAGPVAAGARPLARGRDVPGRQGPGRRALLPVHDRPQGRRHPVPRRGDGAARRRRHAGDADPDEPDQAALAVPRPADLQRSRRPARHHHDHRDDHHGHRTLRELHPADHDRRAGHGVPPAERPEPVAARRAVPVLLSATVPGRHPDRLVGYAPLADQAPPGMDAYLDGDHHVRHLQRRRRRQHHHHRHDDAGPGDDLEPHADLRVRNGGQCRPGPSGPADVHVRPGAAGRRPVDGRQVLRRRPAAAARGCTRTCSGCSATPRSTSS